MSIVQKTVRGVAWSVVTGFGARALGLVGTLLIVRFLAPSEYGEVSAAYIVVATVNQFSTFGLGMYVFAHPRAGRDVLFHATVGHILVGAVALTGLYVFSVQVGQLMAMPYLRIFVPGLMLSSLLDRVGYIPERILLRDLRFARASVARSLGELVYTTVSLALAMAGWGAMSVVYGNIFRSLVRTAGIVSATQWRDWIEPCRVRLATVRALLGYGSSVSLAGLAAFGSRKWDNLLMGSMFGAGTMGVYNLAYNLADVPSVQVGEQVTDVLLASFSQMEPQKRARALVRACTLLGLIMFPLAAGLGAVAPSLGRTLFSSEWAGVAPMLMILSMLAVPRPIGGALTAYLHSMNRPGTVMLLEWFNVAMILGGIATLGLLGPLWACGAVGLSLSIRLFVAMLILRRTDGIPLRDFASGISRPLLACLPMLAVVFGIHSAVTAAGLAPWLGLTMEVVSGGCAYVVAAVVLAREACLELIGHLRRLLPIG